MSKLFNVSALNNSLSQSVFERMAYRALSLRNSAIAAARTHSTSSWNVVVLRKRAHHEPRWILIVQVLDGQETRVFDYDPGCCGTSRSVVVRELLPDGL